VVLDPPALEDEKVAAITAITCKIIDLTYKKNYLYTSQPRNGGTAVVATETTLQEYENMKGEI
jgi:hypothetical protein